MRKKTHNVFIEMMSENRRRILRKKTSEHISIKICLQNRLLCEILAIYLSMFDVSSQTERVEIVEQKL